MESHQQIPSKVTYIMHHLYSRKAEPFRVNIEMQSFIHFANIMILLSSLRFITFFQITTISYKNPNKFKSFLGDPEPPRSLRYQYFTF